MTPTVTSFSKAHPDLVARFLDGADADIAKQVKTAIRRVCMTASSNTLAICVVTPTQGVQAKIPLAAFDAAVASGQIMLDLHPVADERMRPLVDMALSDSEEVSDMGFRGLLSQVMAGADVDRAQLKAAISDPSLVTMFIVALDAKGRIAADFGTTPSRQRIRRH